jgi:hypothetical protein
VFECVCALSRAFLFGGIIIKYDPNIIINTNKLY